MIDRVILFGVEVQLTAGVHVIFPNGEVCELDCEIVHERGIPMVKFDPRAALDMIHRSGNGSRRLGGASVHEEDEQRYRGDVRR